MRKGDLYKHVNCTDVAIKPLRIVQIPKGLKVKVSWYNVVNPNHFWPMGLTEEVLITKEQLPNWKFFKRGE